MANNQKINVMDTYKKIRPMSADTSALQEKDTWDKIKEGVHSATTGLNDALIKNLNTRISFLDASTDEMTPQQKYEYDNATPLSKVVVDPIYDIAAAGAKAVLPESAQSYARGIKRGVASGYAGVVGGISDFVGDTIGGKYMNEVASNNARDKDYTGGEHFSLDYLANPSGLTYDMSNMIGSMVALAPATAAVPESLGAGAVGFAGKLGANALERAGAEKLSQKLASSFLSDVGKTAAGSEAKSAIGKLSDLGSEALGKYYGKTAPSIFLKGVARAIPEGMSEGGNVKRDMLDMGYSMDDAETAARRTMGENALLLAASNSLEGAVMGGKLFNGLPKAGEGFFTKLAKAPLRAAPALGVNSLQNGFEEFAQQGIQNMNENKDYSFNPFSAPQDQIDAGIVGGISGGLMAGLPTIGRAAFGTPKTNTLNNKPIDDTTIESEPEQHTHTLNLPVQSGIQEQVDGLKPEFKAALPVIGGMLDELGVGKGAAISSGYRSPEHNREVGGAENSYHTHGDAVDIVLPEGTTKEQAQKVLEKFKATGAFKEVLFHDVGSGYHLHLGGYNGHLEGAHASNNTNETNNINEDNTSNTEATEEEIKQDNIDVMPQTKTVADDDAKIDLQSEEKQDEQEDTPVQTDTLPTQKEDSKQDTAPANQPTRPHISQENVKNEIKAIKTFAAIQAKKTTDPEEVHFLRELFQNYNNLDDLENNHFKDEDKAIDEIINRYGNTEEFQNFMKYQQSKLSNQEPIKPEKTVQDKLPENNQTQTATPVETKTEPIKDSEVKNETTISPESDNAHVNFYNQVKADIQAGGSENDDPVLLAKKSLMYIAADPKVVATRNSNNTYTLKNNQVGQSVDISADNYKLFSALRDGYNHANKKNLPLLGELSANKKETKKEDPVAKLLKVMPVTHVGENGAQKLTADDIKEVNSGKKKLSEINHAEENHTHKEKKTKKTNVPQILDARVDSSIREAVRARYKRGETYTEIIDNLTDLVGEEKVNMYKDSIDSAYDNAKKEATANAKKSKIIKLGKEDELITDDNEHIKFRYALMAVKEIIASNNPDFSVNKNYPKEYQPRDRERAAMKQQVIEMAQKLEPRRVTEGYNINEGAPIVNQDGVVLNGNGRVLAIRKAYDTNVKADSREAYKKFVTDNLEKWGLTQEQFDKTPNAILVRMIDNPTAEQVDSIINSTSGGERTGGEEQAKKDAKKLTIDTLAKYQYNDNGDITTPDNNEFLSSATKDIVQKGELNSIFDAKGVLNKDGEERIKRALYALAYNNDRLIRENSETDSEGLRNISRAYERCAPNVAQLRLQQEENIYHKEYNLPEVLATALAKYKAIRENDKETVYNYLNTQNMFGAEFEDSQEVKQVVKFIDDNKIKTTNISTFINTAIDFIRQAGHPDQGSLMGMEMELEPFNELLQRAMDRAIGDTATHEQGDLFAEPKTENKTQETQKENKKTVPKKEKDTKPKQDKKFTDVDTARSQLFAKLGIKDKSKEKNKDHKTLVNVIDDSKENEEKLIAELTAELSKISSNAMFNPKIYIAGVKLGAIYIQRGINSLPQWKEKFKGTVEGIEPWLNSIWNTLRDYPTDLKLDEEKLSFATQYVGSLYESGIKSLDDIKKDFSEHAGDDVLKEYDTLLNCVFSGVETIFNPDKVNYNEAKDNTETTKEGAKDNGYGNVSTTQQTGPTDLQNVSNAVQTQTVQADDEARKHKSADSKNNGERERQVRGDSEPSIQRPLQSESGERLSREPSSTERGSSTSKGTSGGRSVSEGSGRTSDRGRSNPLDTVSAVENYHADDTTEENKKSATARLKDNITALKLLKELESEGRRATPEEQKILAKFTGWGGVTSAFSSATNKKELEKILSKEELDSAQSTILSAYYTSPTVVKSMWKLAERLGFNGGRVLEPSMGIGNFFAYMPKELANKSKLTGFELDTVSGGISQQLYQKADINVAGFETIKAPDDYYDLAIGNVPFANFGVNDPKHNSKKYKIHNYFVQKALDKVRPGGLVMLITTTRTMDESRGDSERLRKELINQAEFIGAIRLPDTAFTHTGTQVNSDIIVLRKLGGGKIVDSHPWLEGEGRQRGDNGYHFNTNNQYYEEHPNMMIGTLGEVKGQYGTKKNLSGKGINLENKLDKIIQTFPENIYEPLQVKRQTPQQSVSNALTEGLTGKPREKAIVIGKSGKLYQYDGANFQEYKVKGKKRKGIDNANVVVHYVKIRDITKKLLAAQLDDKSSDKVIDELRKQLNKVYDDFVKKYGPINAEDNEKLFVIDPDSGTVRAIEKYNYDRRTDTTTVEKAPIFTKRTIGAIKVADKADNALDGLSLSLQNNGYVDIDYIAKLTNDTPENVAKELTGLIFKNPATDSYEARDEYLSGQVKMKLAEAIEAAKLDPAYKVNVDELRKVQPPDLLPDEISISLGTHWVPKSDMADFINHVLNENAANETDITYIPSTARWVVAKKYSLTSGAKVNKEWGTPDANFRDILELALNKQNKVVKRHISEKETVVDEVATAQIDALIDRLKNEFKKWIYADKDRASRLAQYYNDHYNTEVLREYDGSHLTLPGFNAAGPQLRQHQKDAVWRILQNHNTLLAHCVGAGKTWTMQAAAMEMRRLGIARKPMFVVPNHMLKQFTQEWLQIYPGAQLLTLQTSDIPEVKKDKDGNVTISAQKQSERQKTLARIQTEDWDGIIISHNMFKRIPLSEEASSKYIKEELALLERSIIAAKDGEIDGRIIHTLEERKNNLKTKLEQALKSESKDLGIPFEELGVDALFVDEADLFKNLAYSTSLGNISGLANSNSQRSMDMFYKARWLTQKNGGRGVVFATGTPISNSIAEMYTMLRYMDFEHMKDLNLDMFDNWANQFCVIEKAIERSADTNGYKLVNKVTSFENFPELAKLFKKYADIKRPENLDLPRPKLKGGKVNTVQLEPNAPLKNFIENEVSERVQKIKANGRNNKEDNMLKLTGELRRGSLDMRILNPSLSGDEVGAKLNACADLIYKEYKDSNQRNGAQLVFCDLSTPKGVSNKAKDDVETDIDTDNETDDEITSKFNVYHEVKRLLIEKGIPEKEIAFIHDAKTAIAKQDLFNDVNAGVVRILMGSTEKMGAGTNCQKKLVALHHLDCPWRPRDLEQREGRILRQGNENDEVSIYNYVTKASYDANMWEKVKNKQTLIAQALSADISQRRMEDADVTVLSMAEAEALASGNPLMAEKTLVDTDVAKYQARKAGWLSKRNDAQKKLAKYPVEIKDEQEIAQKIEKDIADRPNLKGDNFSVTLKDKVVTKRTEADKALKILLAQVLEKQEARRVVGKIGNFDIVAKYVGTNYSVNGQMVLGGSSATVKVELIGNRAYEVTTNSMTGIENTYNTAPEKKLSLAKDGIRTKEQEIDSLKVVAEQPFEDEDKLESLLVRQKEINDSIQASLEQGHRQSENNPEDTTEGTKSTEIEEPEQKQPEQTTENTPEPKVNIEDTTNGKWIDTEAKAKDVESSNEYSATKLEPYTHTKTGQQLHKVTLANQVDHDVYKSINSLSRKYGTSYSRYAKGWLFEDEKTANNFRKDVEAKFNPKPKFSADSTINKKAPAKSADVVTITGNEFGKYKDIKELREKAKAFYKNYLQGTSVVNKYLGKIDVDNITNVEFTGKGSKKSFSAGANELKLLCTKYLNRLVTNAKVINYAENYKKHTRALGYYTLKTDIEFNGEYHNVIITLAKHSNDHIVYYNHGLGMKNEGVPKHFSKTGPESSPYDEARGNLPDFGSPSVNSNITEDVSTVNNNDNKCSIDTVNTSTFNNKSVSDILDLATIVHGAKLTKQQEILSKIGESLGNPIVWVDAPSGLRGWHVNGVSFLNRKANWPLNKVFWHESLHSMIANNPGLYNEFVKALGDSISDNQIEAYRKNVLHGDILSRDEIIEEMLADNMADVAKRVKLMQGLSTQKPGLIKRVVEFLHDLMQRFTTFMNNKDGRLTNDQRDTMIKAFAKLAGSLKDSQGNKLFNVINGQIQFANKEFMSISNEEIQAWHEQEKAALDTIFGDNPLKARFSSDNSVDSTQGLYKHLPKAIYTTLERIGLKPKSAEQIEVYHKEIQKSMTPILDTYLRSPHRLGEKFPVLKPLVIMGENAELLQNRLRSEFTNDLSLAYKGLSKADRDSLHELMLDGDANAIEFGAGISDINKRIEAVKNETGVNDKVTRAYISIRKIMDKAYNLVDSTRRQTQLKHEVVSLKDLEKLKANKFIDIQYEKETTDDLGNPAAEVDYIEYKNWVSQQIVTKEELNRLKEDDNIQILSIKEGHQDLLHNQHYYDDRFIPESTNDVKLDDYKTYTVLMRETTPPLSKINGYIPHFFHEFMVYKKNEESGELEVIGSGRTENQAIQTGLDYLEANNDTTSKLVVKPKGFDFENNLGISTANYAVTVGDKDYTTLVNKFAQEFEITTKEARNLLSDKVKTKNRHRFLGNTMHRKGANGYDRDINWIIPHYLNSVSRYVALEKEFKPHAISYYERMFGPFDKDVVDIARYAKTYIEGMNGNPNELENMVTNFIMKNPIFRNLATNSPFKERVALAWTNKALSVTAVGKLGLFNISSSLLNYTQLLNVTMYLTGKENPRKAVARLGKALKDVFVGNYNGLTEDEKRAMYDSGVDHDVSMDSGAGYGKTVRGLADKTMFFFNASEKHCRRSTILAAYRQGIDKGMTHDEAVAYAKELNRKSNFAYGVQDAPGIYRAISGTIVGDLVLQFQKYNLKELEVIADALSNRTNAKQKAVFWGGFLLLGGLFGLPGMGLICSIIASLWRDPKEAIKEYLFAWASSTNNPLSKFIVKTICYGILSNIGVDISNRFGMADVVPGTGPDYDKDLSFLQKTFSTFGGATGSTAVQVWNAYQAENYSKMLKAYSPALGNIYTAAIGKSYDDRGRISTEYNTPSERLIHAIGFRTTKESIAGDLTNIKYDNMDRMSKEKRETIDAFLRAEEKGENTIEIRRKLKQLGVKENAIKKARIERRKDRMGRLDNFKKGKRPDYFKGADNLEE